MIQTAHSNQQLVDLLSADFIADKTPLETSAGFSPQSEFAGQPRQTFSLRLSPESVAAVREQVQGLYSEFIKDCWPQGEPLPFDMIRFDAFLNPTNNALKILEINTRNVGLHEVVEWLDTTVAERLGVEPVGSLNQRFVENQKLLHAHHFGADAPLLYMSPSFLPKWTYLEELKKAYSSVRHITSAEEADYNERGIMVDGVQYQAMTKKLAWAATDTIKELDRAGAIRVLQPRWMRPFGLKNYLQKLSSPAILRTESYTDERLEHYVQNKNSLVLKIIDGGNSKAVYLGGMFDQPAWGQKLKEASAMPNKWIVQDYCQPPLMNIFAHGIGAKQLPSQLGIFVLPSLTDSTTFDMDITVKAYAGNDEHFTFDPSGLNPDIWFGHTIKSVA